MKEIRDWLTKTVSRTRWTVRLLINSVEHMLKNRRYIGELKFRDVVVPDAIPPIVPLELFDDVQEKIRQKTRKPLPVERQRTIICSPPSCSAATVGR